MHGHILIVDDEPALLDFFAEVLREAGLTVVTAPEPRAALAELERTAFDAVVSDIMMPGMSGIEFLRALEEKDPDLPVVLITGRPTVETAVQALEHGAVRYLLKPVTAADLEAGVTHALALRKMSQLRREALAYLQKHVAVRDDRAALGRDLTRALGSVWMAYQPIFRASDGTLFGQEALLRSDDARLAGAAGLLDAAERLGRTAELGQIVRAHVAADGSGGRLGGALFVNLHPLDLADDTLLDPQGPLAKIAPEVVLEITERGALDTVPHAAARIRSLRDLGFRIALDDLGAGYAGLNSFATLNPEVVKLDIELVRGSHAESVKRKLIGSVASLCRELGILVVAEGVETPEDRDVVVSEGCDLLQGFLLGRPARSPVLRGDAVCVSIWPVRRAERTLP